MLIHLNSLWKSYELIDCGNLKKLEKFGEYTVIRPEISAKNTPKLSYHDWTDIADAEFFETEKNKGFWKKYNDNINTWQISYKNIPININAELTLTNSKHIGVFPEQVLNWIFLKKISTEVSNYKLLNLFAHTGLTSIASSFFAEQVTHIDSIKKIVSRAKKNMELSEQKNVRFIVEDAQKFVSREIKRNNKYSGIVLDPPQIGVGTNNEKWILSEMLDNLLQNITKITCNKSFIIMNLYAQSINQNQIRNLVFKYFKNYKIETCEKVFGLSKYENNIDHGYFVRGVKF